MTRLEKKNLRFIAVGMSIVGILAGLVQLITVWLGDLSLAPVIGGAALGGLAFLFTMPVRGIVIFGLAGVVGGLAFHGVSTVASVPIAVIASGIGTVIAVVVLTWIDEYCLQDS